MKHLTTLFFVLLFPLCVMAQEVFEWENPSFEGEPKASTLPEGWKDVFAGSKNTPADIQPGNFGCSIHAHHGKTYVGMVVREDGSQEGIYQNLSIGLQQDSIYTFSLWACVSPSYYSITNFSNGNPVSFFKPVKLMIIGIDTRTQKEVRLATSILIGQTSWENYQFSFIVPDKDINAIGIVTVPSRTQSNYYNGNVLIDNLSPIRKEPFSESRKKQLQKSTGIPDSDHFILLKNPDLDGNGVISKDHKWDLFVATKDSLVYYTESSKICGTVYNDSLSNLVKKEMEPNFRFDGLYMVGNKNGKWTGVGQLLNEKLKKDSTYSWPIVLKWGIMGQLKENKEPLRLYIWAGTAENPRQEMLVKTYGIDTRNSKTYTYTFTPQKGDWDYIYLEAHSITDGITYYNGNLILQTCMPIEKVKK